MPERSEAKPVSTPVLFPVGHYLGPFHPAPGAPADYHLVRVGWDSPHLPDETHVDVWGLVHGLPARIGSTAWTREAVCGAAEEAGVADPDQVIDHLIELGVVAEVTPGSPSAVGFARTHRVQSLLVGLGNTPDAGALDAIGVIGLPPVVRVEPEVFEFWQLAQLWPDLWSAAQAFAAVARDGGDPQAETNAEAVLDRFFRALRTLIAHNAVFLDVVLP